MKTRRNLVDRAAENLGVLASGQTLAAEDLAGIDAFVETTIADLRKRDVLYVPDAAEIDEEIFEDLSVCLAFRCRIKFGLAGDPEIAAANLASEKSLRIKSAQGPTYAVAKTTFY